MKVTGLGEPNSVRIRFRQRELGVLVDVLREHRAHATREAAETHATPRAQPRDLDDRHNRLRAIEALLIQLDESPRTGRGAVLLGDTGVLSDVLRDGAREAFQRLAQAHERYQDHANPETGDALVDAAKTANAWAATLTSFDRVDQGWQQ